MLISVAYPQQIFWENFNDQDADWPFRVFDTKHNNYEGPFSFSSSPRLGVEGYSLEGDHAFSGFSVVIIVNEIPEWIDDGLYVRYYRYHPAANDPSGKPEYYDWTQCYGDVRFGGDSTKTCQEQDAPWNYKLFWLVSQRSSDNTEDWGNIWKDIYTLDLDYGKECEGRYLLYYGSSTFRKGVWQKYEWHVKLEAQGNGCSKLWYHFQIDDIDITNATLPGTDLVSGRNFESYVMFEPQEVVNTQQIVSIQATGSGCGLPETDHGFWYIDNITLVVGGGDMCDNEPPEEGGPVIFPPRRPSGIKVTR